MVPDSIGRCSISPSLNSAFAYLRPYFAFVSLALQIISGVASTPRAFPWLPTIGDALNTSIPPPLPRSRTTSPSRGLISCRGEPHPASTKAASTGTASTNWMFVDSSAEPSPPQQSDVEQVAIFEYRSLTARLTSSSDTVLPWFQELFIDRAVLR